MRAARRRITGLACALAMTATGTLPAYAETTVAPGNFHAEQPDIPKASSNRTRALKTTYERKYQKVVHLLKTDEKLIENIKQTAADFDIDPIHMIGAIVGEHTYNVDALDRAQTYYVKAMSYIQGDIRFVHEGENVDTFIQRPEFTHCDKYSSSYDLWSCREAVWDKDFRGKIIDQARFPNDRFSAVFFQPFYAGQTFGIGQLNPLTALKMTDRVAKETGARKLSHTDGKRLYETIINPEKTLPYIAATIATAIDSYREIAGFDISRNPGLTATLYNTGNPAKRAALLRSKNASSNRLIMPEENYYGWLINDREDELRALLEDV